MVRVLKAIFAGLLTTLPAHADTHSPTPGWPNEFLARVEALALIETLNAELLSNDSATLTLERWCAAHRLAPEPRIVAERVRGAEKQPTEKLREDLNATASHPIRYRRVRLLCGTTVLSEADNWYLPDRLTPEMNRLLDTTDTPFGRAVMDLHFRRRTVSAKLLWRPLPEGWEMNAAATGTEAKDMPLPPYVLEHRAVLALPDGTPFSEVVETYTGNILAFPCPCVLGDNQYRKLRPHAAAKGHPE